MLAMVQHDLAADDHVVHAVRTLHAPRRARGSVARDLVLAHPDRGGVEDHEVRRHAGPDEATIGEPHDPRRLEGVAANRVLERQQLPLAHPLGQHPAGLARSAEVRVQVRTGVRL